ncbi:Dysferlin [Phytophthora ramorum]|uniref:Dysferlin n=1 Tax=Phytophthora ramorum TaxID=164328 RepID=UPI00309A54B4|nr:Dysferlin [Phytophthora ramorum]
MAEVETPRVRLVVAGASGLGEGQATAFDPYCQAQCGDVVLRTAAQAKTTTPTWAQNFTFGVKKPLGDAVTFKVFGLNERGRDILLGSASLAIETLTPDTQTTHNLTLEDAGAQSCGQLTVQATYEPTFMAPPRKEGGGTPKKQLADPVPPKSGNTPPDIGEDKPSAEDVTGAAPAAASPVEAEVQQPTQPPNCYVVTVLEALGLLACDGTGIEATSDPYVRISCTKNQSQRTKTQQQTLHPSWRQRFYFSIVPGEKQLLELNVEDSDLLTSDFMGRCVIDLDEFTKRFLGEKQTFWLALEQQPEAKDKDAPSDLSPQRKMNYGNGKICLAIEMQYLDRDISTLEQGEIDNVTEVPSGRGLRGPGSSDAAVDDGGNDGNHADDPNEETNDGGDDNDADAKREEAEAQRKQKEEERQKMLAELSNVQFLSGDYQIRVRIIEVRDLQPMDANGLCDPVVSVECLGQRQHTVVKQKQLSCVFDEYLYFNFRKLDKDTVQQGSIKISVFDADGPGSSANRSAISRSFDDLVGFFSVDIPYVYFQPDHELKRKWVALVGSGTTNSDNIQGYVLLSLVVLGPGDKMKLYDPAEDRDPDEHLVKTKADINSMVLVPPRVSQKLSFLVVTIYRADELPDMDYSMMMHGGIDGYVRAYFAGQDVLETKKITVKGSENLTVIFNQELWFPVLLPTMSDNIFLSMWDWDMTTADQLVANILRPFSFKQVQRYPNQFKHMWSNLYGPPVGYDTDSSVLQLMQNHPAHASTYRGRLLMSLRVEDGLQSVNDEAHVRNLLNASISPRMKRYTLRTALFYGTEIPVFTSKTNWNRNTRMSLKISIGRHSVESSRADNVSGICHFNQYIDIVDVELPEDLNQVPDVFVHLVRQTMNESRCICFARFNAKDLFCQDSEALKTIAPPHWVVLNEDKVLDELEDHDFTGNVLMNLRLEDADQKRRKEEEVAQQWRQYASTTVQYMKYVLFIHVFQGKCLPSADFDGLLDPYVKVVCVGSEGQVSTRMSTRDPCYYETVILDVELPQNELFLPKVSLQVFDWDRYDADDYIGGMKFSLADFPQMSSSEYSKIRASGEYSAPRPKWYPICYEKAGDTQGELLLSFDLIKKDTPGVIVEPPESIRPPAEEAFVEIMCLGCRGLQPTGFMPINTPFAKFEIGEITKTNQPKFTNPSSKPSSRNPNFLQRIVVPVKLPIDSLFAPRLNVTVYDQLLGGFYKPVIGVCSVDLSRKMPLSNGEPNPLYIEESSKSVTRGSNPYVDYGDDLSTFPGTVPSGVLNARSPNASGEKSAANKPNKIGVVGICSSGSFGVYDDDEDELPHYMNQRQIIEGELEDTLKSPFETYTLFRGYSSRDHCDSSEQSSDTYRSVGKFKGIVRVLKSRDEPPLFDLEQFLNPQPYLVRVYVLDALNLHPKDANNRCDPYLRVSLGDGRRREQLFNDRDNYQAETLTPKFHKMYEFKADLPGASELKLEVLDYDFFAIPTLPTGLSKALSTAVGTTVDGDDFVGATLIDLEDRWFDAKWQELGLTSERPERRKPLEVRPLFAPSSTLPQGNLRMWVDILTGAEMNVVRPLDISLPPPQMFEVRVIVYKAKNVTAGDFTDLSDLFVKCWLQNRDDKSQSTDTHWRARHGRASFNWRMKFDVELPLDPEKEADRGYLHFQMWDRDVVYDDCLADAVVDLTPFLKTAFKSKQAVNVFANPKPVRIRGTESMPYEGASRRSGYSAVEDATSAARLRSPHSGEVVISIDEEGRDNDRKPLLSGEDADIDGEAETETEDVDADMENAESLVKSFMHRLGMGDDPEEASWLTMTTRDSHTGDRVRAGELLISVEILPKHLAGVRSAGLGRGEPNNFPFLPEPADRLHLSAMWNPCYVLEALMGPKYYRAFASFFLCTVFVILVLFAGPLINVLLTLFELIPEPFGLILFFLALAALMGTIVYLLYRCRRAIIRVSGGGADFKPSTRSKRKARRALR